MKPSIHPPVTHLRRFTRSRSPARRSCLLTAIVALSLVLSACLTPLPNEVVRLEISADGTYTLNGAQVERAALADALRSARPSSKQLLVRLIPSPESKYEHVSFAVEAVRAVGASIGVVGNQRFQDVLANDTQPFGRADSPRQAGVCGSPQTLGISTTAISIMRPDQSDYLAHFTKGDKAYDSRVSILKDGVVYAGNLPWTGKPAACFTECPWSSLLAHAAQYSPYGVGFTKPHVFAAGGGPAFYVRADHYKKQEWADHAHTFVTPFWPKYRPANLKGPDHLGGKTIDYAHEREWRVPHAFSFKPEQVQFAILNTYDDMAKFPKELKDAIGREKFILMDMYRKVEELWPTHLVD